MSTTRREDRIKAETKEDYWKVRKTFLGLEHISTYEIRSKFPGINQDVRTLPAHLPEDCKGPVDTNYRIGCFWLCINYYYYYYYCNIINAVKVLVKIFSTSAAALD